MLWHLGRKVLRIRRRCQAVEPLGCISIYIGLQVGQLKCTAPIYATYPVSKMGQMFLYDQCLNRAAVSEFDAYDLNDVDAAFGHITTLKYQQVFSLSGKSQRFPPHAQQQGAQCSAIEQSQNATSSHTGVVWLTKMLCRCSAICQSSVRYMPMGVYVTCDTSGRAMRQGSY